MIPLSARPGNFSMYLIVFLASASVPFIKEVLDGRLRK
jgi:hypothetical protein